MNDIDSYKYSHKSKDKSLVSLCVYNVGSQQCTPLFQYGPGIRDHYLIHLIDHGRGIYKANGNTYHLRGGDVFCVLPNTEVYYQADEDNPWEYQWVGFAGVDAARMVEAAGFSPESLIMHSISWQKELSDSLRRIETAFGNTYAASVRMTGELCLALTLFFEHSQKKASSKIQTKNELRTTIGRAVAYINANYSYDISIMDVAAYAGVSRSTLYRQFVRFVHKTPQEFLETCRMNHAQALLTETDLPISSVANSVGISDAMYFSKLFHRIVGMPPTIFRAMSEKKEEDLRKESAHLLQP